MPGPCEGARELVPASALTRAEGLARQAPAVDAHRHAFMAANVAPGRDDMFLAGPGLAEYERPQQPVARGKRRFRIELDQAVRGRYGVQVCARQSCLLLHLLGCSTEGKVPCFAQNVHYPRRFAACRIQVLEDAPMHQIEA